MSAQDTVAKAFVGEGIRVQWDAHVPYADLRNRVIHLRPMPEEVSEKELEDVCADCDHEIAHFLYTDLDVMEAIDREMVKLLTNAIDDGFIERKHGARYLGCGENLEASNIRMLAEMKKGRTDTPQNRRARAITGLVRLSFGKTEAEVYEELGEDIGDLIDQVRDLLPNVDNVNSTGAAYDLAVQIADRWRWDSPFESPDESAEISAGGSGSEPLDQAGEDAVAESLKGSILTGRRKRGIASLSFKRSWIYRAKKDDDEIESVPAPDPTVFSLADTHQHFIAGVRQIAGPLRRRLLMEFRGPGPKTARQQRRGKIDDRSLHKVPTGDERVFKSDIRDIVLNRDVTLMVDCSASMLYSESIYGGDVLESRCKSSLWIAAQAACACSLVLDLIGVSNEVLAWTTVEHGKRDLNYERVSPLRHMIVKPATGSFHACQRNFTKLALLRDPLENIDGEALLWGAQRLARRARRTGRKPVLIVFSDGEPLSSPEDEVVLSRHLKESIKRIERAGIPSMGIGIHSKAVKDYYPRWTVVEHLSDLVSEFYVLLRDELRKSKKVV